jgi:hypothetical protein
MPDLPGLCQFSALLNSPGAAETLWKQWLELDNVIDAEESGVVVATGVPHAERLGVVQRTAASEGWGPELDDYWSFLARYNGLAIDQGGDGPPRFAEVAVSELTYPTVWPVSSMEPDALAHAELPGVEATWCFGEHADCGHLFFRRTSSGFFRKRTTVDVCFYDAKSSEHVTRLAGTFDELLRKLIEGRLRITNVFTASGAPGW